MYYLKISLILFGFVLITGMIGCSDDRAKSGDSKESANLTTDRDSREENSSKREKSGTEYTLSETCNQIRDGVRLRLSYDAQRNAFKGTIKNMTSKTLKQVRVEVHLSNGEELGPTPPENLAPGKKAEVFLKAFNKKFNKWSAHSEVDGGEQDHGEGEGEQDHEGRMEHE